VQDLERVGGCQLRVIRLDVHVRIDVADAIARRVQLGASDIAGAVQDLTLEVREIHDVEVHEPERADTGRGEIQRDRRAEPPRSDDEHPRRLELALTRQLDVGEEEMASVPLRFQLGEFGRHVLSFGLRRRFTY
jgi:hypothetical protein